jgi:hypothetical protein
MPTPSKFTEARRRVVLGALGCGASRRTAAKLAGIDHQTLGRWLERGQRASPEGRWGRFYWAAVAAEADPKLRVFPNLDDEPNMSTTWRFLERTEFMLEREEPVRITVVLHDGTPFLGS